MIRVENWPAALSDKATAAQLEGATYEGYEQKSGRRTGIYRAR